VVVVVVLYVLPVRLRLSTLEMADSSVVVVVRTICKQPLKLMVEVVVLLVVVVAQWQQTRRERLVLVVTAS
jgi:hypothetical protein